MEPSELGPGESREEWHLLRLPPQSSPVYFKVRGTNYFFNGQWGDNQFYYEEHTCPINWLGNVEEVQIAGELDPHGLWELAGQFETEKGIDDRMTLLRNDNANSRSL